MIIFQTVIHFADMNSLDNMDLYRHQQRLPPTQHELKRPDSVITTSSIVSSDTASQAGDSSTEASGPPSAYAISGLYGSIQSSKKVVHRRRTHSGSLGLANEPVVTNNPSAVSTGNTVNTGTSGEREVITAAAITGSEHLVLSKSNSCAANTSGSVNSKTHRRQTSHPTSSGMVLPPVPLAKATAAAVAEMNSQKILKGHRRSHSHGHHKGFHDVVAGSRHRRTGSSVIETLQTLACTGAEQDNPNDSIAQFLENLRKEQAEK